MRKALLLLSILVCAFSASAQQITEGSLFANDAKGKALGPCPLKTTSVRADISGFVARITVRQEFENKFTMPIEAVYAFPLSHNGAVDRMTMTIGDRNITGKIMRREEARAVYESAKAEGKTASLLDQERENIFTQSVANIMPGQGVTVEISYVETLKYEDGAYEWVFPMTIGPRYIPAGVKDAAKVTPPIAETRAGHDISVEVNLNAGVPVEGIRSTSHDIDQVNATPSTAKVTLRDEKVIPNKDFVLRYDVTGNRIEDAVLTHADDRGGFFTLILQPPDKFVNEDRTPKEIVFVLDTSGSMSGFPIEKAKEAMKLSLDGLYPDDTFNLITFAGDTQIVFDKPVTATEANIEKAQAVLDQQRGYGGTEMMTAIKAALEPSDASDHVRVVCFMTDGEVGNDDQIVAEVQKHPKARVFAFGIGTSVNRSLLDRISREGRGEAEYVSLTDDGSKAAKSFYERVRTPLLTDISIDWNGLPVADIYPSRIEDLFSAKPLIIKGRFTKAASGTIKLKGLVAGQPYEREIKVDLPQKESANDSLATLWARQRIDELTSQSLQADTDAKRTNFVKMITGVGLEYGLMTSYTSFVAVEDKIVNEGGKQVTKQVPVELPAGQRRGDSGAEADVINTRQMQTLPSSVSGGGGAQISMVTVSAGISASVDVSSTSQAKRAKPRRGSGQGSGRGSGSGSGTGYGSGNGIASGDGDSPPPRAISGGVISAKALNLPQPVYPSAAKAMNAQGSVTVQVVIDETGKVVSATPLSGNPLFRASAVTAAQQATFAPTMLSGKPVKVTGVVVYNFGMTGQSQPSVGGFSEATTENLKTPAAMEDPVDGRLKSKLHNWLYTLLLRLGNDDAKPGSNEALFVEDGKANISIQLKNSSQATLEKLKAAGFEFGRGNSKNLVVGKIAIDKLAGLAEIDEVILVLPQI